MEIPLEVCKIWHFSHTEDLSGFEYMDYDKLMVMELEFFKQIDDNISTKVKVKAPDNLAFGTWFQKFILDYNIKTPLTPIELVDKKTGNDYGWIFYVKRSFFFPRKYIDYDLTIPDNKIREKHTIIAKRVTENNSSNDNDNDKVEKMNENNENEQII